VSLQPARRPRGVACAVDGRELGRRVRHRIAARTALTLGAVGTLVAATGAVGWSGSDGGSEAVVAAAPDTASPASPGPAVPTATAAPAADTPAPCDADGAPRCPHDPSTREQPRPSRWPTEPAADDCTTGPDAPTGRLEVVAGTHDPGGDGALRRVRVEVEAGLGIDPACFARQALAVLNDARGWPSHRFAHVDGDDADLRLVLASPATVDALCRPIPTNGRFSCWDGRRVNLNVARWRGGARPFGEDVTTYRQYLVNHEVGHALGAGHVGCPRAGAPAPVMMQQTKSTGACVPNGWPAP
jgi:hypothetical protein